MCGGLLALAGRHDATALVADLAILFVAGAARAFAFPAQQALLPAIVSEERYVSASAAASAVRELVRIGAPAAGGVLVALGMLPAYATVIAGATAAAALAVRIPLLTAPPRVAPSTFRDVFAGAAFLRARPVLSGAISLDLFAVFFGGATALLPIYAAQVLHVGAVGFGALRAAASAGTALCAAVLARRPIRRFAGPRLLAAVAAFGAATIVFGLSRTVWLSFAALAALGAADMVSMVIRDALLALQTPNVMRGRVSAVEGVFIVASNELGEFESGILAAFVGAVPAVVIGGLATLCVVALWTAANPALRKADRLSSG